MKTFTVIRREIHTIEYDVEAGKLADIIEGKVAWKIKDTISTETLEITLIELKD